MLQFIGEFFRLQCGIFKPISRPDAYKLPPEPLQNLLAQAVTIPGALASVITRTVTLNAREEDLRVIRMPNAEINLEAGNTNLRDTLRPVFLVLSSLRLSLMPRINRAWHLYRFTWPDQAGALYSPISSRALV